MGKALPILFFFFLAFSVKAQELNCSVTINSDKIAGSNKQVYQTLQTALTEFVNQNKWTDKNYKLQERIDCAFTIIINSQPSANRFEGTLQVQSARPVYGSSYSTPILNIKDNQFNFNYTEFEPLNYDATVFESNLVSVIVFYINLIIGIDANSFSRVGGGKYIKRAEDVMLLAQQSGESGWEDRIGQQNRYQLISSLTSTKSREFGRINYNYHREGMDFFSSDKQKAKQAIENAILEIEGLYDKRVGSYLIRLFFNAKTDEIVSIFSDGPETSKKRELIEALRRMSPINRSKWQKIK